MDCFLVALLLQLPLIAICLLFKKITENYDYWLRQNVPFVKPYPIIGSVQIFDRKPLHEEEKEWYEKYGPVYGRFEGTNPVLSVGDPDVLKNIYVKDGRFFQNRRDMKFHDPIMDNTLFILEGHPWKRVRTIMSPIFTAAKLRKMVGVIEESCDVLVKKLCESESEIIECQELFEGFVLHTIGRCAFGMNMNSLQNPNSTFIQKAKKLLEEKFSWRTLLTILCPTLMKAFRIKLLNPETTEYYKNIIEQVLEERKKHNVIQDDVLQNLMKAGDMFEDSNNNGDTMCPEDSCSESTTDINHKKSTNKGLSHDEMLAQCVTFFVAGFEPTTALLSNIVYNLAIHPDYQNQVVEEMTTAIKNNNNEICYDSLAELKFTDAVINESLRMCPAMVRSERRCQEDYYIQERDIVLKKGMLVSIPVYAMGRDETLYPEPHVFNPNRFYEPATSFKCIHLPFGEGLRRCVGERFVLLQVKMCLAKILMKFEILRAPTTPESLTYTESRNILKVGKLEVRLRERSSS